VTAPAVTRANAGVAPTPPARGSWPDAGRGEVTVVARKSWKDLSDQQRRFVVAGAAVQFTLQFLALRDLRRRPAAEVRGPKWGWVALTSVNFFGPIAYFVLGRRRTPTAG
jgi:hypothetical protein